VAVLTQLWPHWTSPEAHSLVQLLFEQTSFAAQPWPHAPQWTASLESDTHSLAHRTCPAGQALEYGLPPLSPSAAEQA